MDGKTFALAHFPPNMHLENQVRSPSPLSPPARTDSPPASQAYTVLESTTDSVFLHVTTHPDLGSEWGTLFKSNWNGTYYSPTIEYVNRNSKGFVDFEKMIGLDGIAVINVVSNPEEAALSSNKKLQSRITHNDGGRWKPMIPPTKDVLGQQYDCSGTVRLLSCLFPFPSSLPDFFSLGRAAPSTSTATPSARTLVLPTRPPRPSVSCSRSATSASTSSPTPTRTRSSLATVASPGRRFTRTRTCGSTATKGRSLSSRTTRTLRTTSRTRSTRVFRGATTPSASPFASGASSPSRWIRHASSSSSVPSRTVQSRL